MMTIIRWCVLLCAVLFAIPAFAATVTLNWDANTEADLAGYNLYGVAKACTSTLDTDLQEVKSLGLVTGTTLTITTDGEYCYALKARDVAGNKSAFSNKIAVTVNTNPPAAPRNLRATVAP